MSKYRRLGLGYEYVIMTDPPTLGHPVLNPGAPRHRCEPLLAGWIAGANRQQRGTMGGG
ncbi:hypothetical protein L208DRAFT_1389168 [Tricholoma matsutake]|nr:hypothetical protein L208DRAFT_1389168 [Tricholoma matsutake 945]